MAHPTKHNNLEASLQIILDSLPGETGEHDRRTRTITRQDAQLISDMIQVAVSNRGCSIGLTEQQMSAIRDIPADTFREIKNVVKERRRLLNALGGLTLAVLAFIGKWIFEKIDWYKVWVFITNK